MIEDILQSTTVESIKDKLSLLMKELAVCLLKAKQSIQQEKKPADPENLSGTYEEMFSNWHGKMIQAAELGDRHLAFMSLVSLNPDRGSFFAGLSGDVTNNHFQKAMFCGTLIVP